jgi:CHAT domain-containing protein/tetratricopeptide (TPR) repeat protein
MGRKIWQTRIILMVLAVIFTLIAEWIFVPILLPKVDAKNINFSTQIAVNSSEAEILLEKAQRLYDAKRFSEAILILKQAGQLFKNQGNHLKHAIALSNIANSYQQIAEYQQALNYITQSRQLLETLPKLRDSQKLFTVFAQVLDIQAHLQLELGKPLAALDNWKQATAIYEGANLSNEKNRSLINQNLALQALGRYRQASQILDKLISQLNQQPNSIIKVLAWRNLGEVQMFLRETDTAIKTLQESYKLAQEIKSTPQITLTLLSLGNAQFAIGNRLRSRLQNTTNFQKTLPLFYTNPPISDDVKQLYQQAVTTNQKVVKISTSASITIKAQLNLLNLFIQLKEFAQVSKLYFQLQPVINKLPASATSIHTRISFAQSLLSLKQNGSIDTLKWENIAQILALAIQQAEAIGDVRSQSYAMGVLGAIYYQTQNLTDAQKLTKKAVDLALGIDAKEIAYIWQWQLGYIFKQQQNTAKAKDYYYQSVSNINDLRSDLFFISSDLQFSFRDNIEPVYRQFVDLLLKPLNSDNIGFKRINKEKINQANLKIARDVIEALQLREIENYLQEACLRAKPEIVDTVVDTTDTTAAVIYPIILENRLEIILKLPLQKQFYHYTTFVSADEFEKTLEQLQNSLIQPDQINQVRETSAKIYNWLIQPLAADLQANQIETLVFILDGALRNIPMAVLYDGNQDKYLIEKYAIALTPGLQMLDPKPLTQHKLSALLGGISEKISIENKQFSPLQYVKLEIQTIRSQIPNSQKILNQDFTDINLKKQIDSEKYNVIHIATHGNFSSNLENTYILTWNKLLKTKDLDKLFQTNTNQQDYQAIQLFVLSACETATGDKRATLGLSGIVIRAGARSTLATLWAVDDNSTAELMGKFYQELKINKLNKAKALQKAQIDMLKSGELPLNWSPYILVGNWL